MLRTIAIACILVAVGCVQPDDAVQTDTAALSGEKQLDVYELMDYLLAVQAPQPVDGPVKDPDRDTAITFASLADLGKLSDRDQCEVFAEDQPQLPRCAAIWSGIQTLSKDSPTGGNGCTTVWHCEHAYHSGHFTLDLTPQICTKCTTCCTIVDGRKVCETACDRPSVAW
jgi:hypothetical protein